ncbi:hypothetical protein O988_02807 [Pseudogymnoascus sp. VKM F-3808]|nr:hypothetical protein O988_02807 [Pseudogymnoascus sp. VKM F-3808]
MANSEYADGIYRNVSEPVSIPKRVSPTGSAISEEPTRISETENDLNNLENSPGIESSPEPMDVDMPETVAEVWARSMDEIGADLSYEREDTTAERQVNAYEYHMPRQHIMDSRDSWRPRESQDFYDRWSQSRAGYRGGLRGRGFTGRGFRGRGYGGRGPRGFGNRGFRSREFRYQQSRGGRRAYQHPHQFIPRGPSTWNSQTRHDNYDLSSTQRERTNRDRDRNYHYRRSDIGL